MPCWYYDKKELRNTPSIQDGYDYETECRYRKEGARFIIDTGMKMDLGYNTAATGVVYFHRFYMFHSFKEFPRYITACCCLFLAGKVEETPKKCRDIIKTAQTLISEDKFRVNGDSDLKEEVMTLERILLQTIKFDLQVEHPYSYLIKYAKCLKGEKNKSPNTMVQMAWTFVNDSLCTTLSLQWEPEIIAVALMHLAGKLSNFKVVNWSGRTSKHLRWWDMFVEGITMELLEDICHQVLDLYSNACINNTVPESPPTPKPMPKPVKEKPSQVTSSESGSNTPKESAKKVQKVDKNSTNSNGYSPTDVMVTMNDLPMHQPPFPTNNYPVAYPPPDMSLPPPSHANVMNHMGQPRHHFNASGPQPSSPMTPNIRQFPHSFPPSAQTFYAGQSPHSAGRNPYPPKS